MQESSSYHAIEPSLCSASKGRCFLSDDIHIRPLDAGDLPAITAIYGAHVQGGTASFEEVPPDEAEMRARWQANLGRGYPAWLVATRDDRVLGYAYAGPHKARSAYRFTVEDSIYLDPDCLGQGIGSSLLKALIEACRAGGYRQIMAVIGDSDNAGSIALHTRFGFRHVGTARSVGYKHGRWLDVVFMQLSLVGADGSPR